MWELETDAYPRTALRGPVDPHFHQHIPIPKLSDGCPPLWDMAQLQEGQPRTVPTCCHCPLCLGMAGAARQQPTLLAATRSSMVPNLCQFPTRSALQGRAGLGYLLRSNLRVMRTHSFSAGAELVLSMNRTGV